MSIVEVAKAAGVSIATVSRVINGLPGVSAKRAEHIRKVMNQLGYQPRPVSRRPGQRTGSPRNFSKNGSCIAAVVVDNLYRYTPGVFIDHLKGIEHGARDHGLNLMVIQVSSDLRSVQTALQGSQVEGLVLMGAQGEPDVLAWLERFPSVWLSSHRGSDSSAVLAGNYRIGSLAAEYLIGRGHRNLGFLSVMAQYPAYPARSEAFEFAAQRAKATAKAFLSPVPETFIGNPDEMAALRKGVDQLVRQMLDAQPRITGLFVPNDMMTALVYPALDLQDVRPGRDIDIISCNNESTYLMGLRPRPATIDIGAETMGRRSVEMLLWRIRHPEESRGVQVAVEPVLLESQEW